MPPSRHRRAVVGGGVALALIGLWLGHTAEYARVWGTAGLDTEFFGSIHAYMLPLAALLALLVSTLALRLWHVWIALGRRLDRGRETVLALLRGRAAEVAAPVHVEQGPSFWSGIAVAWPALTLLQVALYVLQENIEALAGGAPAPGLGAITGVHALAPLLHAGVALGLLVSTAVALRFLKRRAAAIAQVEAIARVLLRTLAARAPRIASPPSRAVAPPLVLFGIGLRQRPPPPQLLTV